MKHTRLISAFLAFLLVFPSCILAQSDMHSVKEYAGISPLPQQMWQGGVAFTVPTPSNIKIIKGIVGDKSVRKYANKVPRQSEGYYVSIDSKQIILVGRDEDGLYYAEQSLQQLLDYSDKVLKTEIIDYPSVECRGAIEGFYGNPWSHQDRLRQFQFYGRNKMNTYVYGPKDDPYHRRHWREAYPEKEAALLRELAQEAKRNHVQFVWAVHPGLDIKWNLQDSIAIVKKLESVYSLGIRSFAVFFDDIGGEGTRPEKQASLMNYITDEFVRKHTDVQPLILCPTQYNKAWSSGDYLPTLGRLMYPEIRIMWTGNSVVDMIESNDMEWINGKIGRKAFIWLNYPVNDYCQSRILMGKTYGNGLDIAPMLSGFCSNPMEYAEASKVSLYSIADYTWNMLAYDAESSWERAIRQLMPTSADAFKIFCENNIDLGVTGHGLRREGESPVFRPYLDILNGKASKGKSLYNSIDFNKLSVEFIDLYVASITLLQDSVNQPEMLREIAPWVEAMELSASRGFFTCQAATCLQRGDSTSFLHFYKLIRNEEEKQKRIVSRNFEGSIVKAKPAFSGDVVTPFIKQLNDTLISLYKQQYTTGWDVFPHGILPDGDYYILYDGKLLTDSLASPTQTGDFPIFMTEKDVINPQRQLWHFAYNDKTECYNITNVQDGRYVNEIGSFWRNMQQNPFDPAYHSFSIEKQGDRYSIRQTNRGGSAYWLSNGRRITTGNAANNHVFQIVAKDEYVETSK